MNPIYKPITGTWFSIYWNDKRHFYWNDACLRYTAEQWDALLGDLYGMGVRDLVMCNVMIGGKCIYDSAITPKIQMVCDDPMEAVFQAADRRGMHIYMTNDYDEHFDFKEILCADSVRERTVILEELVCRYGQHPSFYGWYWAWEACIEPYYTDHFIQYVNGNSAVGRALKPGSQVLIAPYGTKNARCDDLYCRQLEQLDVDIIAYQDTVGCYATDVEGSRRAFEALRKAHDRVPQRKLYADVETFAWEGTPNRKGTALIPADFNRLLEQLAAVSPYVDEVYAFIMQGLFSNPDSAAHTGYAPAATYYKQYMRWLAERK